MHIEISAFVWSVGKLSVIEKNIDYSNLLSLTEANVVRCPDPKIASKMIDYISELKGNGDSVGGQIKCIVIIYNKFGRAGL